PMKYATECTELASTAADWSRAKPELLETMLVQMSVVRVFEEVVLDLASQGLVHGPAHSSIGQEAAAVGSVLALRGSDGVNGTHRGHHQFIAKGLSFFQDGYRLSETPGSEAGELREFLHKTLAEILGLRDGFSGGRGGSMHLQFPRIGGLGTNAIVGGGVPLAAGNAWAQLHDAQRAAGDADAAGDLDADVTVTYFGDGASNIGSTLETFNLASAWKLPLCFFIENNRYAVSTLVDDVTGETRLGARGPGFGIRSWRVDGQDVLAVFTAMQEAVAHMRAGKGPAVVEADTYRYFHQNGPFPGSAFGYRTKAEEREWRARDPLERVIETLAERGTATRDDYDAFVQRVRSSVEAIAAEFLEPDPNGKPGARRIRAEAWPDTATVDDGVLGEPRYDGPIVDPAAGTPADAVERRFVDAIADVIDARMAGDDGIVVLGEDVHRLKGGTNGATRGLTDKYPGRVLGTPIAENAFTGLAGGLSQTGRYRPIVEYMYSDFLMVAADQAFNQVGKARHMFGSQTAMPIVLRSKVAMGAGYGSQHSMDPAGLFASYPGWRIVAPSNAADYVGLMNTALDLEDPVLVLEHVDLYGRTDQVPATLDGRLEVGRAAVRREGSGVTVLSYLNMVGLALEAAEARPELDAEVVDLRWLDRTSLDWDTIAASVRKTGNVLIVEQGARGTSYGGWLADELQRRLFDYLDQPIQRVTGRLASPTISKVLEAAANADLDDVLAGFAEVERGRGRA
ncbi:MAG: alpha-ketoacid dehydrogenase subunit alpha/beta, partial [Pseudoclavibacter sp.]